MKWLVMFSVVFVVTSCGLTDDDEAICPTPPINSSLKQVMYWTEADPRNWVPNGDSPTGVISNPVWISTDTILVLTAQAQSGSLIKGVFEVVVNPSSLSFIAHIIHEFDPDIWLMAYDSNVRKPMIVYIDQLQTRASYVDLSQTQLVLESEIVEPDWDPWAISSWPGQPGTVFYGTDPVGTTSGFYWRYENSSQQTVDSLLCSVSVDPWLARGFSIASDGMHLFYGTTTGVLSQARTTFWKLDITTPGQSPVKMVEKRGRFVAIRPHPVDPNLVLINFDFFGDSNSGPRDFIQKLNTTTFETNDLDVRTFSGYCAYVGNEFPSWSPNGLHFVYSAWRTDGKGSVQSAIQLWAYQNVP